MATPVSFPPEKGFCLPPHFPADDGRVPRAGTPPPAVEWLDRDRKSTRLNSSHVKSSYAVFCPTLPPPYPPLLPYTTLFRSPRPPRLARCCRNLRSRFSLYRSWRLPSPFHPKRVFACRPISLPMTGASRGQAPRPRPSNGLTEIGRAHV